MSDIDRVDTAPPYTAAAPSQNRPGVPGSGGYRLIRHFTLAALAAFVLVGTALYFLEQRQRNFFKSMQQEQHLFFKSVQESFAAQQDAAARQELLRVFESGHVTLARVFANSLWERELVPVVDRAREISVDGCRAMPDASAGGGNLPSPEKAACYAGIGQRLMTFPEFAALEARVRDTIRRTAVFRIKVFDLRGITVYSSQHAQVGEDQAGNEGWRRAMEGAPASELIHRDKFSAFEGVVEDRDLISSYVPLYAPGGDTVLGVLEIFSDVTPFLQQIRRASEQTIRMNAQNQARIEEVAAANQAKVDASATGLLLGIGGLMALLYFAMFLIVRSGQRIIDRHERERERTIARERRWHREKMAALATMAANVAHEVGNPLNVIMATAENIAARRPPGSMDDAQPAIIIEQTQRMAGMIRRIADFAAEHGSTPQPLDLNQAVKDVCDFMSFDRRFRATSIEFRPAAELPVPTLAADPLSAALMNLLQVCVEGDERSHAPPDRIVVETIAEGELRIRIACAGGVGGATAGAQKFAEGERIALTRWLIEEMGGRLRCDAAESCRFEVALPCNAADFGTRPTGERAGSAGPGLSARL